MTNVTTICLERENGMEERRTQGPSLESYMETRFNLVLELIKQMDERAQSRMAEYDIRYEQRFMAQQNAISKSEAATEVRLQSMNEFRSALSDQSRTFIPRTEVSALVKGLSDKIEAIENRINIRDGTFLGNKEEQTESRATIGMWVAIISVVVGVIAFILKIYK